jgi:signal transduction histidine kinase
MRNFFRRLSLPKKLILIGVIPSAVLAFVSFQLIKEKSKKLELLEVYTQRIYQTENISNLIDGLQNERKLSYDHSVSQSAETGLTGQRRSTDSIINILKNSRDDVIKRFEEYTFVKGLPAIRKRVDDTLARPGEIMSAYTNMIFRLNTLNTSFPASSVYLVPVSNDLAAQRTLAEMVTYLGIIRANIFNVLQSKKDSIGTLAGTYGIHQVFHTYESELGVKATPEVSKRYDELKRNTELRPTLDYIDSLFKRFRFDARYDAETWWSVSGAGIEQLRSLQQRLWTSTKKRIADLVTEEKDEKNRTLAFLIISLVLVLALVAYTIHIISSMLDELKVAAGKIALGDTDVVVDIRSDDAIGSLAESIHKMEAQVRERATALAEMNTELERSNKDLEQFAYVASHDLQEPVRKIRTFAGQLKDLSYDQLDEKSKRHVDKIISSAERMKKIIGDLLDFSHLNRDESQMEKVDLNRILEDVKTDLELLIQQKEAVIRIDKLPVIDAIPVQMTQLFYNLMNNALKFSVEGVAPVISVTIDNDSAGGPSRDQTKNYLTIRFADNGIGFEQEYANRIFTMFQRLSSGYAGTGIGLALCKKIVENHKGSIQAQSQPGKGASFKIVLPFRQ